MTLYINLDTDEFPRFEGDVAIDPNANWAEVVETTCPATLEDEIAYQTEPDLVDGQYFQVWVVRKLNADEMKPIKEQLGNS